MSAVQAPLLADPARAAGAVGTAGAARPAPASPRTPAPRPTAPRPVAPRLHVVRAPAHARTRAPFVVTCMALLVSSLLGALLLNTSMAEGEYDRFALQTRLARSAQAQQSLTERLEHAASPHQVAEAARELGMVPASGVAYLRLADGAVLGSPTPAAEEVRE